MYPSSHLDNNSKSSIHVPNLQIRPSIPPSNMNVKPPVLNLPIRPPVPSPSMSSKPPIRPSVPSPSMSIRPPVPSPSMSTRPPVPSPSMPIRPPVPSPSMPSKPPIRPSVPSPSMPSKPYVLNLPVKPPVPSPNMPSKPQLRPPVPSPSMSIRHPVPSPSMPIRPPVPSPSIPSKLQLRPPVPSKLQLRPSVPSPSISNIPSLPVRQNKLSPKIQKSTGINFTPEIIDEDTIIGLAVTMDENNFRRLLDYLSEYYHNDESLVSDEIYDQLTDIYEAKYGTYDIVGAEPTGEKVDLPYYLGSLRKLKEENELVRWLDEYKGPYLIEDKIDGLTLLVVSEVIQGKRITNLYTRGKGYQGRDVSHLLQYINFPQWLKMGKIEIPGSDISNISIRGEVVMTRETFKRVGAGFSNARNLVSGIVNSKKGFNPSLAKELSFYAYRIMESAMIPSEEIITLQTMGFDVPSPASATRLNKTVLENYYEQRNTISPYDMDGLVIYQDINKEYPVGSAPRHVVAFKTQIMSETAITVVTEIKWHGSKDRLLNPVVYYEPVNISGAILRKAYGYNARFIVENNIGPGAKILIIRSGDVIPKIIDILSPAPNGPDYPKNRSYTWNANQVEFVLTQDDDEVITNKLRHFIETLGIKNVGKMRIRLLVDSGVKTIDQLIRLSPDYLLNVPGFGTKLSGQFYNDIHDSITNVSIAKIMDASGIFKGIGEKRFDSILEAYPDFLTFADADPETVANLIRQVKGFDTLGEEIASKLKLFVDWLHSNPMIKINTDTETAIASDLGGMTIVFSGFRDKNLETQIKQRGGKVTTSVSRNTSFVVMKDVNDRKGKANEAIAKGVPLISKEDFIKQYLY